MRSRFRSILHGSSTARAGVENVLSVRRLRSPADHWGRTSVICGTSQFSQRKYVPDLVQPRRHRYQPTSDPTALHQPEPDDVDAGRHRSAPAHDRVPPTWWWTGPGDAGPPPAFGDPQAASGSGEKLT